MIEAIKAAHFNQAKYQTTTIINADDAVVGTGMFVKSSAEEGKKESEEISFFSAYDDEVCYLTLEVKQAWYINVQELLVEHSKNYHVDFNIYASESGMEFEQYITVVEGELIKNEEKEYTDFYFEAINPELGG